MVAREAYPEPAKTWPTAEWSRDPGYLHPGGGRGGQSSNEVIGTPEAVRHGRQRAERAIKQDQSQQE